MPDWSESQVSNDDQSLVRFQQLGHFYFLNYFNHPQQQQLGHVDYINIISIFLILYTYYYSNLSTTTGNTEELFY